MKTEKLKELFMLLMVSCFLAGCTSPSPRPTPTPGNTSIPTITLTPTMSAALTVTDTPTLVPTLAFGTGQLIEVDAGGYAFKLPEPLNNGSPFSVELDEANVILVSPDDMVQAVVFTQTFERDIDLEIGMQELMDTMDDVEFIGKAVPITVDGYLGLRIGYHHDMDGENLAGEIFRIDLGVRRAMGILAGAMAVNAAERWRIEGEPFINALLETMIIYEPAPEDPQAACPISMDPTFGFDPANPVKVGGDFLEGPSRERTYLNHLRGPSGEAVIYEREGSEEFEGTILDIYHLDYDGLDQPVILYVDIFTWATPFAPVGFTCAGPFPLEAP